MQQEPTVKPYETKTIDSLLYNRKPAVIDSIIERRHHRYLPRGARSDIVAGNQVEVEITHDMASDLRTLRADFEFVSSDGASKISNALDIFEIIEIYYNDVLIEKISNAGEWANAFLAMSAHPEWFKREAQALLGISNQVVLGAHGDRLTTNHESYTVPICLASGFCRSKYFLPIVGNKLRLVMTMASNKKVLSLKPGAVTQTYKLNNFSVTMDDIILQSQYRGKILEAMQSSGFRVPFTSYQTNRLAVSASTEQNLVLNANLSNAISLFILHDPVATKAEVKDVYCCYNQSFPLSTFTNLQVSCGSRMFGPSDGYKTYSELYASTEECLNYLCDLSCSGYIDYTIFKAGYTANASTTAGTYGLCLIGVNLEKSVENDDSTINNGISAQDGFSQFNIKLTTSGNLADTSAFLTNLVHKRALVFSGSGVAVEF